jgi:hypothetical protein
MKGALERCSDTAQAATTDMAADIFTNALDRLKVQKCAKMLGLGTIQDSGDMH